MRRAHISDQFSSYILQFAFCILFLSACGQHESSSAISPDAIQVTFKVLEAPVSGMKANLTISGMTGPNSDGSYPMTVNPDGSVTATMSGVPQGTHTFTISYYDPSGLTIAQASTSGGVTAGQNNPISITSSQLNTTFDSDGDGFTNLDEVKAGSNPRDPGSRPTASTFTLTITKSGTGTGTVTSSPAGISCGATCSASYNSGTSVTLTATPVAGSTFAGWSGGGCTGTGTCTVTMSTATSVTATFNPADTTPPDTTITAQPSSPTNSTSASFSFTSTETGSTFQCSLDAGAFAACTSPQAYTLLAAGSHTFSVKATDAAGNIDATPATYTWTIDLTAPTVISTSPSNGAKSVAVNTLITANFSELMNATTITSATFTLTSAAGPVTGIISYAGNTATFTPSGNLASLTTYTATITTGVKDLAGNPMAANFTWSFTTSAGPASFGPVTFFAAGTTPASVAIADLNSDGKPDLAVVNQNSNNVSILLNQPASAPAKATILAEPGGEQVVSNQDDSHSFFGCGGIDLKGGSSGPPDMGGLVSLLAMLSLPFIMRRWRNYRRNQMSRGEVSSP